MNKVQQYKLDFSLNTTDKFSLREKKQIKKQYGILGNSFGSSSGFRAIMGTNEVKYKYADLPNLKINPIKDIKGELIGGVITAKPYGKKASQYWNDSIKSINDYPDIEYSPEEFLEFVNPDPNVIIEVDIINFDQDINYRDMRVAKLLAHEMGEAIYKIENPVQGFIWEEIGDKNLGGHDTNNPIGKAAEDQETIFDKNKKSINWDEVSK